MGLKWTTLFWCRELLITTCAFHPLGWWPTRNVSKNEESKTCASARAKHTSLYSLGLCKWPQWKLERQEARRLLSHHCRKLANIECDPVGHLRCTGIVSIALLSLASALSQRALCISQEGKHFVCVCLGVCYGHREALALQVLNWSSLRNLF